MQLVILDRDGVINENRDNYVKSVDEFVPIDGSIEAIAKLSINGFKVAIATNQAGIGRGLYDSAVLAVIHQKLSDLVQQAGGTISTIVYCPHTPQDNCNCRKPATGLIQQIENNLGVSAKNSLLVGDSLKDMQTALACHCRPVLVLTGHGKNTLIEISQKKYPVIPYFDNLSLFVSNLLQKLES